MDSLRGDRAVRAEVWKTFEPTTQQVERLVQRVHASVDRNSIWAARLGKLRVVSSAAACILVGFLIGRVANRPGDATVGGGLASGRPPGQLNVVQVPQGSLYPALHRLENRRLLSADWQNTGTGREAKFYRLTRKGRTALERDAASWARLTEAVGLILNISDGGAE